MTPEFKQSATQIVERWKEEGLDAVHAIRALEVLCGKNAEEFHPEGQRIVEGVYWGRFAPAIGGTGLTFVPKPKEEGNYIVYKPIIEEGESHAAKKGALTEDNQPEHSD